MSVGAATGNILIKRVGPSLTVTDAPAGTLARYDGGTTDAANPSSFPSVAIGAHTLSATDAVAYTETAGHCDYLIGNAECSVATFIDTVTCAAGYCNVSGTNGTVSTGNVRKVAFLYTPISAPSVTLTANPTSVVFNGTSNLTWSATGNITSCTASNNQANPNWTGAKATSGGPVTTGALTVTTIFTLSCTGPGGTTPATATVSVGAATLFVSLAVAPASGTVPPPFTSVLTATVSGTAIGNITYQFDCTNDGIYENTQTIAGTTATFSCTYSLTSTAKVFVTRQAITAQDTKLVTANPAGSFTITHSKRFEPDPTVPATADCHYYPASPLCNIDYSGGTEPSRKAHFFKDIGIAQLESDITYLQIHWTGPLPEPIFLTIDVVDRDDRTDGLYGTNNCPVAPLVIATPCANGVGDAIDGGNVYPNGVAIPSPSTSGFLYYFNGDPSQTFTTIVPNGLGQYAPVQLNALVQNPPGQIGGRYIVYVKGIGTSGKTYIDQVLLVIGLNTPGYREK